MWWRFRRIPIQQIPQDTEGCNQWVHQLYQEKDQIYDYFVQHGTFEGNGLPRVEIRRNLWDLIIELTWMSLIGIPSLIYLFKFLWTSSFLAQLICLILVTIGRRILTSNTYHLFYDFLSATIGVRAMISVTETARGSHYGETQKDKWFDFCDIFSRTIFDWFLGYFTMYSCNKFKNPSTDWCSSSSIHFNQNISKKTYTRFDSLFFFFLFCYQWHLLFFSFLVVLL